MNPRKNVRCTRGPWSFSSTSGSGIPSGHCILSPCRFRPSATHRMGLMQKGQLYGKLVTNEERDQLGLTYGYTQWYSRNTCKFVMSRAARKRGYKTEDYYYLRRESENVKKPF